MKVLRKAGCFMIVLMSMIEYKVRRGTQTYWEWAYQRISQEKSMLENSYCLIRFLLGDAIAHNDQHAIVKLCQTHWDAGNMDELSPKYLRYLHDVAAESDCNWLLHRVRSVLPYADIEGNKS